MSSILFKIVIIIIFYSFLMLLKRYQQHCVYTIIVFFIIIISIILNNINNIVLSVFDTIFKVIWIKNFHEDDYRLHIFYSVMIKKIHRKFQIKSISGL